MPTDGQRIQKRTLPPWLCRSQARKQPFVTELALLKTSAYTASGCNGACVETRRARDPEVLPRQHPIAGKGKFIVIIWRRHDTPLVELHSRSGRGWTLRNPQEWKCSSASI